MTIIHLKQCELPIPEGLITETACQKIVPHAKFAFVDAPDKLTVFEPFIAQICGACQDACNYERLFSRGPFYTYGLIPGQESIPLPLPTQEETRELCHA